jgi:hypothetical protein
LVGGNATPTLPAGDPGQVSVIATGPPNADSAAGTVAVIVRNNTSKTLTSITLSATARDPNGTLIGSGSDQGIQPNPTKPGEIAFGYVYFGTQLPATAQLDIKAQADTTSSKVGLKINEANLAPGQFGIQQIVGTATNTTDKKVSGPAAVMVECFDASGALHHADTGYAKPDDAEAGETVSFSVDLRDQCATFLVAASGYSF